VRFSQASYFGVANLYREEPFMNQVSKAVNYSPTIEIDPRGRFMFERIEAGTFREIFLR
jgi:hypothetical protein